MMTARAFLISTLLILSASNAPAQVGAEHPAYPDLSGLEKPTRAGIESYIEEYEKTLASSAGAVERGKASGFLGMVFHAHQLRQPAIRFYQKAREGNPENYLWPYLIGILHYDETRFAEALQSFQAAHEKASNLAIIRYRLGQAHEALENIEQARSHYRVYSNWKPNDAAGHVANGRMLLRQGNPKEAIQAFEEALSVEPRFTKIHYHMAMAYRQLGKEDLARQRLEQYGDIEAQPIDPILGRVYELSMSPEILSLGGRRAFRTGRYEKARDLFKRAVGLAPEDETAWLYLGRSELALDDLKAAENALRRALEVNPSYWLARELLGRTLEQAGRPEEAATIYKNALEQKEINNEARVSLARLYFRTEQYQKAGELFRDAAETDAGEPQYKYWQALSLRFADECPEAVNILETNARNAGDKVRWALALIRLHAVCDLPNNNKLEQYRSLAHDLYNRSPQLATAEALGMIMAATGQKEDAIAYLRQALFEAAKTQDAAIAERIKENIARVNDGRPLIDRPLPGDPVMPLPVPASNSLQESG